MVFRSIGRWRTRRDEFLDHDSDSRTMPDESGAWPMAASAAAAGSQSGRTIIPFALYRRAFPASDIDVRVNSD
jgi:hypothetical protein